MVNASLKFYGSYGCNLTCETDFELVTSGGASPFGARGTSKLQIECTKRQSGYWTVAENGKMSDKA